MNDTALGLAGLTKRYGSVVAVDDVSLDVAMGERRAVIGPNGAGKSTLFALAAGTLRPSSGSVSLSGRDVTRLRDHQRARLGLVKTFQHSSLFPAMSLRDNVVLAAQRRHGGAWHPFGRHSHRVVDAAHEALARVGLVERADARVAALSHGERRQVEIALALALAPDVLLLDEPTAGMSAAETSSFVNLLREIPRDITILIIEHDLDVVFSVADRVTVLHLGAIIADGTPDEVRSSEIVQRTYLGLAPDSTQDTSSSAGASEAGSTTGTLA
ncbi:ABC transporter ATP-binding protein [Nonomuraea sp. NPDC049400]|uniref:ABC transporter ATP-binding protein n=1 Tax=Nonomuraea sp. NPDC049400 TaxID=3364352 RepID=UPI0037BD4A1F